MLPSGKPPTPNVMARTSGDAELRSAMMFYLTNISVYSKFLSVSFVKFWTNSKLNYSNIEANVVLAKLSFNCEP